MNYQESGTVAALQFAERPPLDFADIVEEFDIAFQTGSVRQRRLTWDCDDVAIFDRETVRVALGWMQPDAPGQPWYLIVAVGNSPEVPAAPVSRDFCENLATHILERTQEYLPYDAVYRSEADRPVDAELIDAVTEQLMQAANAASGPVQPATASGTHAATLHEHAIQGAPSWYSHLLKNFRRPIANEHANINAGVHMKMGLDEEDDDMRKLRESVCGTTEETEITLPMHLSIYALGATMLIQAPPVGAALLIYTVLREEFNAAA